MAYSTVFVCVLPYLFIVSKCSNTITITAATTETKVSSSNLTITNITGFSVNGNSSSKYSTGNSETNTPLPSILTTDSNYSEEVGGHVLDEERTPISDGSNYSGSDVSDLYSTATTYSEHDASSTPTNSIGTGVSVDTTPVNTTSPDNNISPAGVKATGEIPTTVDDTSSTTSEPPKSAFTSVNDTSNSSMSTTVGEAETPVENIASTTDEPPESNLENDSNADEGTTSVDTTSPTAETTVENISAEQTSSGNDFSGNEDTDSTSAIYSDSSTDVDIHVPTDISTSAETTVSTVSSTDNTDVVTNDSTTKSISTETITSATIDMKPTIVTEETSTDMGPTDISTSAETTVDTVSSTDNTDGVTNVSTTNSTSTETITPTTIVTKPTIVTEETSMDMHETTTETPERHTDATVAVLTSILVILVVGGSLVIGVILFRQGKLPWIRQNLDGREPPQSIPLSKFENHCSQLLNTPECLGSEFKLLQMLSQDIANSNTTTAATLPENKRKNRYINILPYDMTRVTLEVTVNDPSDYINASYIKGYSKEREYIACQGPKEDTVEDFWRMIIQEKVYLIVMVTNFEEGDKKKCEPYFPKLRESMIVGENVIRCTTELPFLLFTQRTLDVHMEASKITVTHLHFNEWPDFGCPEGTFPMLHFCGTIREHLSRNPGLLLVHCSAGVGRTGTLIAVDILLQHIQENKKVNIFDTVHKLREQRTNMVQTEGQYEYIYKCIKDALEDSSVFKQGSSPSNSLEPIYENVSTKPSSLCRYEKISETIARPKLNSSESECEL